MTIVPPHHNLSNNQEQLRRILDKGVGGGYGGYPPGDDCYHGIDSSLAMVDPSMAEDELRTSGCNKPKEQGTPPSASASWSKGFRGPDEDEDDEGWLQLSIGGRTGRDRNGGNKSGDGRDRSVSAARGLVELDLLPPGRRSSAGINKLEATSPSSTTPTIGLSTATMSSPPLLFQHQHGSSSGVGSEFPYHHPEIINWGFRPVFRGQGILGGAVAGTSSYSSYPSSSSSSMPYASPYFGRPFQLQQIGGGVDRGAGPSRDVIKIIDPPRRRHSGIWFMLLASQNQDREPFLPQITKSYLRIKDGRMTIRLLTKYLVNKLKLDSESEVEITCRGQELRHDFTLQHVRDNIWSPRKDSSSSSTTTTTTTTSVPVVTWLPDSSTTQHLMVLYYSPRRRITPTPTTTISPS